MAFPYSVFLKLAGCCVALLSFCSFGFAQKSSPLETGMSAMGQLARNTAAARRVHKGIWDGDDSPAGGQSEISMAVDSTGKHIVVGFNDIRGFSNTPISVSGFEYSDDGGATFTDGGQLPTHAASGAQLPQVFGDPEVKYLGGSNFIYFSIEVKQMGTTNSSVQSMCFHRSTDYGHTWAGPFEVSPASNPNGLLNADGSPQDAADKEFADVDPDTGRVMMSWSNFTPKVVEIGATFCDNIMAATPVWSKRKVLNVPLSTVFETGCIPRFGGNGSKNAYVAWNQQVSHAAGSGAVDENIAVAVSKDNGATWGPPTKLRSTSFFGPDYVLGNDRIHAFPWMAVDTSKGIHSGNVYVVYLDNSRHDGGDIAFQRSTDGGKTWSTSFEVNARPGSDRSQWFPNVVVDNSTGRVFVGWDDQKIQTTGDLMEMMFTSSADGGLTWSRPQPSSDHPFRAGLGNDLGQPNLGDYNGIWAQNGHAYFCFAQNPFTTVFSNGLPSTRMQLPIVTERSFSNFALGVELGTPSYTNGRGSAFIDPGLTQTFTIPIINYTTNPKDGAATFTGITGTLSSSTPGVQILSGTSAYPNLVAGGIGHNTTGYVVRLSSTFLPGTPIDFKLHVAGTQGVADLLFEQTTGTPAATLLLSENFDGVQPGSFPAGWQPIHVDGPNLANWTTMKGAFGDATNGLFHLDVFNPNVGNQSLNDAIFGPTLTVPAAAQWVTFDFDIAYDTDFETALNVMDFDGCFLFISDVTPNDPFRNVLAEAYADQFVTTFAGGSRLHYPKHFPRGSRPYLADMSNWGGISKGTEHVHIRLPGMGGMSFQPHWQYTQDQSNTGSKSDPGKPLYGVVIDNVKIQAITAVKPPNHLPVATDDTHSTLHDTVMTLVKPGVLSNDSDADHDTLYATLIHGPAHGTLALGGSGDVKYTPAAGFHGFDTFTYKAFDGIGYSNVATCGIIVKSTTFGMGIMPTSVKGGSGNSTGLILLNSPAPNGGLKILLSSSNGAAATVPTFVTVPAGSSIAQFVITSHPIGIASTTSTITARNGAEINTAVLTVTH